MILTVAQRKGWSFESPLVRNKSLVSMQTCTSEPHAITPVCMPSQKQPSSNRPGRLKAGRCMYIHLAHLQAEPNSASKLDVLLAPMIPVVLGEPSTSPGNTTPHVPNNSPAPCSASKQWLSHPVRLCPQPTKQTRVPPERCRGLMFDKFVVA